MRPTPLLVVACVVAVVVISCCTADKIRNRTKYYIVHNDREYVKSEKIKEIQRNLVEIMKAFIKVANELNIVYWAEAGTLLGCVRHGDFIPWDDDIDLNVPTKHIQKLKDNLDVLQKYGCTLEFRDHIYRFEMTGRKGYIDLFQVDVFRDKKGTYYDYSLLHNVLRFHRNPILRRISNAFPRVVAPPQSTSKLYKGELFPLKTYAFGKDLHIKGPNYPFPYLRRQYGDWEVLKVFKGHHDNN
jgi:hypothetical protein